MFSSSYGIWQNPQPGGEASSILKIHYEEHTLKHLHLINNDQYVHMCINTYRYLLQSYTAAILCSIIPMWQVLHFMN